MSNLKDRNSARYSSYHDHIGPVYPNLGPAVEKHRRLSDDTPDGRKAYGRAVHKAICKLQRAELMRDGVNRSGQNPHRCASRTAHTTGAAILKAVNQQNAAKLHYDARTFNRKSDAMLEHAYWLAMDETRAARK